jgi:TRAP transporter TAXI family solute receptor
VKRPVVAAACPFGCPWGELGEFVHDAMKPLGYDVILCRNCNRDRGPRLVSASSIPPPLDALDARTGTKERFDAPVDFGITASGILASAYRGEGGYAAGGPLKNLRLIAKIEDPSFLLVAVTADSGIKDLAEIKAQKMKVRILAGGGADAVLKHYGMTRADITSWGGSVNASMGAREAAEFDVIIDDSASPFMNPEGSHWTILSQRHDLKFLDLPEPLIQELAKLPGYQIVSTKWGLVKGVDRNIRTVGRSGESIFARADTPDQAAYDVAKAIDQSRGQLIWLIRRYSLDPRTIADNQGVPLHPGAARYYREMGYIK